MNDSKEYGTLVKTVAVGDEIEFTSSNGEKIFVIVSQNQKNGAYRLVLRAPKAVVISYRKGIRTNDQFSAF
jgi:hypothetical protein